MEHKECLLCGKTSGKSNLCSSCAKQMSANLKKETIKFKTEYDAAYFKDAIYKDYLGFETTWGRETKKNPLDTVCDRGGNIDGRLIDAFHQIRDELRALREENGRLQKEILQLHEAVQLKEVVTEVLPSLQKMERDLA